ncbi:5'/3'-nucleotidase SurE [Alphaproteobacteria bacterium]|nr:5'/3'-nucleotidase SurE [Alphaproteobacteria bacterium]
MTKKINKILITNDDGYDAVGLKILQKIAENFSDNIFIIAPKHNQSAKSRSITINKVINFEQKSSNEWTVDGTPTDCVIFGLNHVLKFNKPDLILSGINAGCNIGDEVSYSGTVAAAWEGALRGIDSIALSQLGGADNLNSYENANKNSVQVIDMLLDFKKNNTMFFNVNFPLFTNTNIFNESLLFTKLAKQKSSDEIFLDSLNNSFKIGRMLTKNEIDDKTDLNTIKNNFISITPLLLDLTDFSEFNNLTVR